MNERDQFANLRRNNTEQIGGEIDLCECVNELDRMRGYH